MHREVTMTHRGITLRVHPGSRAKHDQMLRTAGAGRRVWNEALAIGKQQYQDHKDGKADRPSVTFISLHNLYVQIKQELPWLGELHAHTVRSTLKHWAEAYKRFFCSECGVEKNADVNAALNIRDKWLVENMASGDGASAGGGGSVSWPVKPENVSGVASRPAGAV